MKKLNKNDRKRKALIKKDNQKPKQKRDTRKKDKKLKIGSIYKTKATNVYKRDKPWKRRFVVPVEKQNENIVLDSKYSLTLIIIQFILKFD